MAARKKTSTVKVKPAAKVLNPYEGYYIAAKIRGRRVLCKGRAYNIADLSEKELHELAEDDVYSKYVKRRSK